MQRFYEYRKNYHVYKRRREDASIAPLIAFNFLNLFLNIEQENFQTMKVYQDEDSSIHDGEEAKEDLLHLQLIR
jgi:hypothetical protein